MSDRRSIRVFIALPERLRDALPCDRRAHTGCHSIRCHRLNRLRLTPPGKHQMQNRPVVRSCVDDDHAEGETNKSETLPKNCERRGSMYAIP